MNGNETSTEGRIRRFPRTRIVEHGVHVLAFGTLAATGLVQKFYSLDLSQWLIVHAGGIDTVRFTHRLAGVLFILALFAHMLAGIIGITVKKWQPTMVITKKDFTDLVHNIRYYIGMENSPALGDRYTYKQKFEYWGILTGGLLMMSSGFILWFPVLVTHVLPGEIIPTAKVLHTNEALVIFSIIAIWHIYNSLFSPEVFPLDTSIFTGYISRARMLREHPVELAEAEGKTVEDLLAHHPEKPGAPSGAQNTLENAGKG